MKKFLLIFILCLAAIIQTNDQLSLLCNQNILKDCQKVQGILFAHQFKKVYFKTSDNIKICALFLDQSKTKEIKGTIVYCAGFYPGTKEGMTSFFTLLADQPYNFLFFDARGHRESEGSLFSYESLRNYGSCEYQDIIATIQFLNQYNDTNNINPNIIVHAICSGTFHSIKAIHALQNNKINHHVKGIIFDSGWLKINDIMESTIRAQSHSVFQKTYFSALEGIIQTIVIWIYHLFLKQHHALVQPIDDIITTINCPIFFIHCINDPFVPFQPIKTFTQKHQCPHCWWIQHDSHANYHLENQQVYTEKIKQFLTQILE